MTRGRSVGIGINKTLKYSQKQNLKIQPDRPAFNVIQVLLDSFFQGSISTPADDLGPSGDPRLHFVAQHVIWNFGFEFLNQYRSFGAGTNQAHFAAENVEQLRKFVEVEASQVNPKRGSAVVIFCGPDRSGLFFCILAHRQEFEREKRFSIEAHPLLSIENRTGRGDFDQEGNK